MKYEEWLGEWLELYEESSVKQRTYEQYSGIINKRLIPTPGDYDMDELEARVLQRYIVNLSKSGNAKMGNEFIRSLRQADR